MESRWEGILAWIFNEFWWIFGGKSGGEIEPRSIQKGIKKTEKREIWNNEIARYPKKIALKLSYIVIKL